MGDTGEFAARREADRTLCRNALAGDEEAVQKISERVRAACSRVMSSAPASRIDEVAQVVCVRLLRPLDGSEPKLAQFEGRASLGGWLRVVVAREALRMNQRPEVARKQDWEIEEFGDTDLLASARLDREAYAKNFKAAFQAAFRALSIHERTVLRQHYRDGIGIASLATARRVHRGTLARELAQIRQRLETAVSSELARAFGMSADEQRELRASMLSQLDASLSRLFREVPESF